jgi:hypothetical protein
MKGKITMFRQHLVVLLGLWALGPATAAAWAEELFDARAHDFGSVPRGPTLTHSFRLTNRLDAPIHIAGVRVSCGCVTASALRNNVAPGKETAVVAQMDTRRFAGTKTVTIFVQMDQPQWEEVRLSVTANSRDDVTVSPESFAFGRTQHGLSPSAHVSIALRGNSDWQILESRCDSNYVQTSVKEAGNDSGDARYEVTATLRPETPVGKWYTDVWLTTNDSNVPRVRIPLTVEIEPALRVNPHLADLGRVRVGDEVERKIIIRGATPFRITDVKGADGPLSVKDNAPGSKPVHVVTIKFKPAKVGQLNRSVRISTDMKDEGEVELRIKGQGAPASDQNSEDKDQDR